MPKNKKTIYRRNGAKLVKALFLGNYIYFSDI
jgi:hypothetical protein